MASTGKCPYCGGTVRSDQKFCTNCGAENEHYVADLPGAIVHPQTIEELKEYCAEQGMPLLRMRFFIGEDCREPKAFGIYRDGQDVVVYKNKDTGVRAIRYRGPDEAYGVNELFQKLLDECHKRGIYPDGAPATRSSSDNAAVLKSMPLAGLSIIGLFIAFVLFTAGLGYLFSGCVHRNDGYYSNGNGAVYYHYGDDWYYTYDNDSYWGTWQEAGHFPESDYKEYKLGEDWDSDWGVSNFKTSSTWNEIQESESSHSSSDYDSWDSGDTDWSSDW